MYKIYQSNNYIIVERVNPKETFYGHKKEVFIDKSNLDKPVYGVFNVRNLEEDTIIKIGEIQKQDGSLYTEVEFDTFYTTHTGNFKGGGTAPVLTVTGDSVDNTDPINPVIKAIPLSGTTVGNPITGDIEFDANKRLFNSNGISTSSSIIGSTTFNIESYNNDDSTYASISTIADGGVVVNTSVGGVPAKGLTGASDFSANITNLDYTQKIYVDTKVANVRPYKVYSALLTQNGTTAPVATVLENTLGEVITFLYSEPGNYTIDNQNLFVEGKTFILLGREGFAGTIAPVVSYTFNPPSLGFYNSLQLTSSNQGTGLSTFDNLIKDVSIEIRVYN